MARDAILFEVAFMSARVDSAKFRHELLSVQVFGWVTAGASIDRAAKDLDRQVSLVWRRADTLGLRWSRSRRPAN
jgi:hypothetical protein